jgi:hypothetical protein
MSPPQRPFACVSFGPEILSAHQEYFSATTANNQATPAIAIFSISISLLISGRYHLSKAFKRLLARRLLKIRWLLYRLTV